MSLILFACAAVAIHDADGPILCASGEKVRLNGIAARELDGTCRPNQPCPPGSPFKARSAVAKAIGARIDWKASSPQHLRFKRPVALTCEKTGTSYQRVTAWCRTKAGKDVSCLAVRAGAAVRWEKFDRQRRLVNCG